MFLVGGLGEELSPRNTFLFALPRLPWSPFLAGGLREAGQSAGGKSAGQGLQPAGRVSLRLLGKQCQWLQPGPGRSRSFLFTPAAGLSGETPHNSLQKESYEDSH